MTDDRWPTQPQRTRTDDDPVQAPAAAEDGDAWSRSADAPADGGWRDYQPPAASPSPGQAQSQSQSSSSYPDGESPVAQSFPPPADYPPQYESPTVESPAYASGPYASTQYAGTQYAGGQYAGTQYAGGYDQYQTAPWGDTSGDGPGGRRGGAARGWLPLLLVALLASLIGGGVGSALTMANDDDEPARATATTAPPAQPQAGQTQGAAAPAPDPVIREVVPGSVSSIAQALLPSVVEIAVETPEGGGSGSGVVIRNDGFIITNNHVVGDATQIQVRIASKTFRARLVGTDPDNDLAVIQALNAGSLKPATIGTVNGLKVGDPVVAIGSPLGLAGTVTSGIISALNRRVDVPADNRSGRGTIFGAVQTDAAINPGNSGGALVDGNGRLIGINTAIASLGARAGGVSGSIGLGFAIPIDLANDTANQIITTGKVVHPYIGVNVGTIDEESAAQLNVPAGALLDELVPNGPAAKAGLRPNDVITKVEGTAIASADELVGAIRQRKVGDSITVTYNRGGTEATAKLVLEEKPAG